MTLEHWADLSAKHSELVGQPLRQSSAIRLVRITNAHSVAATSIIRRTGRDEMRDRVEHPICPLWTFVVVVFLWRADDGWDLAPE